MQFEPAPRASPHNPADPPKPARRPFRAALVGSALVHLAALLAIWHRSPPPAVPEVTLERVDVSRDPELLAKLDRIRALIDEPAPVLAALPPPHAADKAPSRSHRAEVTPPREPKPEPARTEIVAKAMAEALPPSTPGPALVRPLLREDFGVRTAAHVEETPLASHELDPNVLRAGAGKSLAMAGGGSGDYDVPRGNPIALNARADFFAAFWRRVQKGVEPFWVHNIHLLPIPAVQKRDYLTRIDLTLAANGAELVGEIRQSCGVSAWDRAAVQAFHDDGLFPDPPPGLIGADGKIHMEDLGFKVVLTGGTFVPMYGDPRSGKLFPGINEGF
jgi:hypothetical protein